MTTAAYENSHSHPDMSARGAMTLLDATATESESVLTTALAKSSHRHGTAAAIRSTLGAVMPRRCRAGEQVVSYNFDNSIQGLPCAAAHIVLGGRPNESISFNGEPPFLRPESVTAAAVIIRTFDDHQQQNGLWS